VHLGQLVRWSTSPLKASAEPRRGADPRAMAAAEIAAYCASSDYAGLSQYCENFELDLRHTEVDLTESVGVYKVDNRLHPPPPPYHGPPSSPAKHLHLRSHRHPDHHPYPPPSLTTLTTTPPPTWW